jgi:hypothetical protein
MDEYQRPSDRPKCEPGTAGLTLQTHEDDNEHADG